MRHFFSVVRPRVLHVVYVFTVYVCECKSGLCALYVSMCVLCAQVVYVHAVAVCVYVSTEVCIFVSVCVYVYVWLCDCLFLCGEVREGCVMGVVCVCVPGEPLHVEGCVVCVYRLQCMCCAPLCVYLYVYLWCACLFLCV